MLLGLATVGTLTALQVTIKGSDQHRARVGALADLQSAGAYIAREGHGVVCPGATAAQIQSLLSTMPGSPNPGVTITVNGAPDCSSGLPKVSLTATHSNGHASDSLDVVIGGITVLSPGDGTGGGGGPGGGSGPCTWGTVSVTYPLTASGNQLNQPLTVQLSYTGDCSSVPAGSVSATLTATVQSGANTINQTLVDSGSGIFETTFGQKALKFRSGNASIAISGASVPVLQFTVG